MTDPLHVRHITRSGGWRPLAAGIAGLVFAFNAFADPPPDRPRLAYTFELATSPALEMTIHLELAGSSTGETVLRVADQWGGVKAGGEDIVSITATDGEGTWLPVERTAPHEVHVHHEPGEDLHVRYTFAENEHRTSSHPDTHRRPVLDRDLFHGYGHLILLLPDHVPHDEACRASFAWSGLGSVGWNAVTSWGAGSTPREVVRTPDELVRALYLAGNVTVLTRTIAGSPLTVSLIGSEWDFTPDEFADTCAEILRLERVLFDDFDRLFYWVSMVPAGEATEHGYSIGGTGLINCFSMMVMPNASLSRETASGRELTRILAHEMFHEWNGQIIEREQPEQLVYWFSEGFTDHYARQILWRGGWMDDAEYAASLTKTFERNAISPARDLPNARIVDDFWRDRHVKQLPYHRGDIVAMLLDHAIRNSSHGRRSLDDLMRIIVDDGRGGTLISTNSLLQRFAEFADPATIEAIRAIVVDGARPEIPSDLFGPGFRVDADTVYQFDLGFDLEASMAAKTVSGVREGSNAFAAGLRDGQPLVGWSVHRDDVNREAVFTIRDGGEETRIVFIPRGEGVSSHRVVPVDRAGENRER